MTDEVKSRKIKGDDKRVSLPVRLSADTHARLMATAQERMVNASIIVERAVVAFLDGLKPVDQEFPA